MPRTLTILGSPKFGGMEVSRTKRLRELEQENRRLKGLLAEAELDNAALNDLVRGNGVWRLIGTLLMTYGVHESDG